MKLTRLVRTTLAVIPAIVTSNVAAAQAAQPCAGRLDCVDVSTFVATVSDFRVSGNDRYKVVTATVRFQNKTTRPLILGFVRGSGVVTDDRGNRYLGTNSDAVRGMGEISSGNIDAKFSLAPNEASDARFEFSFTPRDAILGTAYDMDVTVREINPVSGEQFRLGREHSLGFKGFGTSRITAAPVPASGTQGGVGASNSAPAAGPSGGDPCAGAPRCYNAGKFTADITAVSSSSRRGASRTMVSTRFTVRIRNLTTEPLILAYRAKSAQLVDDVGSRYANDASYNDLIRGIGIIDSDGADPQFSLAPGEARDATFDNQLLLDNGQRRGTVLTFDLTLEELEVLPSRQVRSRRAYVVGFRDIRETVADRGRGLLGGLRDAVKIRTNP